MASERIEIDLKNCQFRKATTVWAHTRHSVSLGMDNRPQNFRILWIPDHRRVYLLGSGKDPMVIPEHNVSGMSPSDMARDAFMMWLGVDPAAAPKIKVERDGTITELPPEPEPEPKANPKSWTKR